MSKCAICGRKSDTTVLYYHVVGKPLKLFDSSDNEQSEAVSYPGGFEEKSVDVCNYCGFFRYSFSDIAISLTVGVLFAVPSIAYFISIALGYLDRTYLSLPIVFLSVSAISLWLGFQKLVDCLNNKKYHVAAAFDIIKRIHPDYLGKGLAANSTAFVTPMYLTKYEYDSLNNRSFAEKIDR